MPVSARRPESVQEKQRMKARLNSLGTIHYEYSYCSKSQLSVDGKSTSPIFQLGDVIIHSARSCAI